MLRTLANYFLGENVQNEGSSRLEEDEDDWVFVDDERTKSVLLVVDNETNNAPQEENEENVQQEEEPIEEDFSWENSLIEHPSVYIASHQQQQQLQREETRPDDEPEVTDRRSGVTTRESTRNTRASRNAPSLPQQQQHPRTNAPSRHLISHNSQSASLEVADVLRQQQLQNQSKKKHCQRNAKVQQNVRNKPQRRSDKQTYTRFSRVNNDRKCC